MKIVQAKISWRYNEVITIQKEDHKAEIQKLREEMARKQ